MPKSGSSMTSGGGGSLWDGGVAHTACGTTSAAIMAVVIRPRYIVVPPFDYSLPKHIFFLAAWEQVPDLRQTRHIRCILDLHRRPVGDMQCRSGEMNAFGMG